MQLGIHKHGGHRQPKSFRINGLDDWISGLVCLNSPACVTTRRGWPGPQVIKPLRIAKRTSSVPLRRPSFFMMWPRCASTV